MKEITNKELMALADKAREFSHAPYSGFTVGAALLAGSGKIYTGCNIENAAFSPSICGERVALFKALSEGETKLLRVAIIGGKKGENGVFCAPCGVCRQAYAEFVSPDFPIVLGSVDNFAEYKLSELLPHSFTKDNIN